MMGKVFFSCTFVSSRLFPESLSRPSRVYLDVSIYLLSTCIPLSSLFRDSHPASMPFRGIPGLRRWSKRFFVMDDYMIAHYRRRGKSGRIMFYVSDIEKIESFPKKKSRFNIKFGHETLQLKAGSAEHRAEWVSAIEKMIQIAKDQQIAPPASPRPQLVQTQSKSPLKSAEEKKWEQWENKQIALENQREFREYLLSIGQVLYISSHKCLLRRVFQCN